MEVNHFHLFEHVRQFDVFMPLDLLAVYYKANRNRVPQFRYDFSCFHYYFHLSFSCLSFCLVWVIAYTPWVKKQRFFQQTNAFLHIYWCSSFLYSPICSVGIKYNQNGSRQNFCPLPFMGIEEISFCGSKFSRLHSSQQCLGIVKIARLPLAGNKIDATHHFSVHAPPALFHQHIT